MAHNKDIVVQLQGALRALLRRCQWFDRNGCCGFPVSPAQSWILELLAAQPRSMKALSQELSVDPSTATRLVEPLVQQGWIERVAMDRDRRVLTLRLMPAGRRLRDQIQRVARGWLESLLLQVRPERRAAVVRALQELAAAADQAMAACCPPARRNRRRTMQTRPQTPRRREDQGEVHS
jgi:DNA-binding MarR family transcriptional regulator